MPAVPLNLPQPNQYERKPQVVTAIGVLSIIIALATMVGCLFVIGWSLAMYARSQMPAVVFAPAPASRNAGQAPVVQSGPVEDETEGLPRAQRQVVISALNRAKPLTAQRTKQVDALLAGKGRVMFPTVDERTTVFQVRQDITGSGVLPSASQGKTGPHFFTIGTGRIELYDAHAVFRPTGSSEVTSVSADDSKPSPGTQPPPLVARPVPNAAAIKRLALPAVNVALEAMVSGALAIYLLIAGILVLRGSLSGSRLHWIYVFVKIPVAIIAVVVTWILWNLYLATLTTTGQTGGFGSAAAVLAMIGIALGVLYPIVLIILLRSRTVRDYYRTAREEALARPY